MLDDPIGPVIRQTEHFTKFALGAEQPLQIRIVRSQLLIDIGLGHPEFLRRQHGKMHPFDDVEPLIVALAHGRTERLL
jgi:hypothetical protein